MTTVLIAWVSAAIIFGVADAIWLSQAGPRIYRPMIGEIMHDGVRFAPAIVFYALYISGLLYFAVMPALERESLTKALAAGALLGLVAYGTYDLSNHATLKVWPTKMTLIDMAWGTFASGLTAVGAYWITQRFT